MASTSNQIQKEMMFGTEDRTPSPPPFPKKQQHRPRCRRVETVLTFPSSKRVQGTPHHSHHHGFPAPNLNPTSHSDPGSSHYKSKSRDNHRYRRSNAKAKAVPSSSSVSVWVRVSDKPPSSSPDNIIPSEDLEVSASSPRKYIPHLNPQKQQNGKASHMEMDIDQEDGDVDGSGDEGYAVVDVSQKFIVADLPARAKGNEMLVESDPHKLCQRQKQIDYGKNTLGYERYLELVPRKQRKKYVHPRTPDIKQVCSKRSWDGQVKKWRRMLHEFDPPTSKNEEIPHQFSSDNGDDGSSDHSEEEKDATTASGSEGSPKKEAVGVLTIYDDWDVDDAMEP